MPLSDEALVKAAQAGDHAAFDELVRRHRDRVFAVALRLCRNHADAEDVLQDTFIAAHRALPRFAGRARFSTWLYRIAFNAAHDAISKRRAGPSIDADELPEPAAPGDPFEQSAQRRAIEQALAKLPDEFREAVVLCDIAGLGANEAGDVMGVPAGTVKSRAFRGRALLATMLREPTSPDAVIQVTEP